VVAVCGRALKIRIYMLYEGRLNVIPTFMQPPTIPKGLYQFIFVELSSSTYKSKAHISGKFTNT